MRCPRFHRSVKTDPTCVVYVGDWLGVTKASGSIRAEWRLFRIWAEKVKTASAGLIPRSSALLATRSSWSLVKAMKVTSRPFIL